MSQQQINLYQPMFRTERKVFSAATIVQVAVVFLVGLLAIYGFARWQVEALDDQLRQLESQRATAMQQLQLLAAQSAPTAQSRLVADQLREAEREVERKSRLLRAFETRQVGNTTGFSAHFAGLARQRVTGLWLTHVEIAAGGVALGGATEAGELVPRYLARLGNEPAFAGTEFSRLRLVRDPQPGADLVRFEADTARAEATP